MTDAFLSDIDGNRNDTLLLGEEWMRVTVLVSDNVTDSEISTVSPIVNPNQKGGGRGPIDGGYRLEGSFLLMPNASPGDHELTFDVRYTDATNETRHLSFNRTLHLVRSIELRRFMIDAGGTSNLVAEVELFLPCDRLSVEFDTDGNVRVETELIERRSLDPGVYRFETGMVHSGLFPSGDEYEVGYDIRADFGNRTIQLTRKNIDPRIISRGDGPFAWALLALILVVVAVVGLVLVLWRRRREPKAWATGVPPPYLTGRS